jgi:hypothetical protein
MKGPGGMIPVTDHEGIFHASGYTVKPRFTVTPGGSLRCRYLGCFSNSSYRQPTARRTASAGISNSASFVVTAGRMLVIKLSMCFLAHSII